MRNKWIFGLIVLVSIAIFFSACDILRPKKTFRVAIRKDARIYHMLFNHLDSLLNENGFDLELIETDDIFDNFDMVTSGMADFTFLNNHSIAVEKKIKQRTRNLRSIMPLAMRVFTVLSKEPLPENSSGYEIFTNKTIGLEGLDGENEINLRSRMEMANIKGIRYVHMDDNPDLIVFWGTLYDSRRQDLVNKGWHLISLPDNFVKFNTNFDPALDPIQIPKLPGDTNSRILSTFSTTVLLVGNNQLGENSCYELVQQIFENKIELINKSQMYSCISEEFNKSALLFPLHEGTRSYLLREQPTILERYADVIALLFSIGALIYALIQAIKANINQRKKDRVDIYFLEFLGIRSEGAKNVEHQMERLQELHNKALVQMTTEKLEKGDFHILSRLIQQELSLLRSSGNHL